MNTYAKQSWIDPRVEVRPSTIMGSGMFARAPIRAGEIVTIWGGTVFTTEESLAGSVDQDTDCQIDEDHFIGNTVEDGQDEDDFVNHSCDPNLWMRDEVTVETRRDIAAGEELTADYGMWVTLAGYIIVEACVCGSPQCRGRITGDDWKRRDFQERMGTHMAPYLVERIKKLHRDQESGPQ